MTKINFLNTYNGVSAWSYVVMGRREYGQKNHKKNFYGHGSGHLLNNHFGIHPLNKY